MPVINIPTQLMREHVVREIVEELGPREGDETSFEYAKRALRTMRRSPNKHEEIRDICTRAIAIVQQLEGNQPPPKAS